MNLYKICHSIVLRALIFLPLGIFGTPSPAVANNFHVVLNGFSQEVSLVAPGYMRLDAYADSTLRLNVFSVDESRRSNLVFSTCVP